MTKSNNLQKSLAAEANYLRGKIITSYSQVEYLLADLSVKLDLDFPYRIDSRIKAAKRIGEREAFRQYRKELHAVCDHLLKFDEIRNLMAHARMELLTDKAGRHQLKLMIYQRKDKDNFTRRTLSTSITRLRIDARKIESYVVAAVKVFEKIYKEKKLEQI